MYLPSFHITGPDCDSAHRFILSVI